MELHLLETAGFTMTVPAWVIGVITFSILMSGLLLVRSVGHRRPHSK